MKAFLEALLVRMTIAILVMHNSETTFPILTHYYLSTVGVALVFLRSNRFTVHKKERSRLSKKILIGCCQAVASCTYVKI